MKHAFFLAPAGIDVGLTTIALGLVSALDQRGVRVAFFKPIAQRREGDTGPERSTHFIRATTNLRTADPIPLPKATKTIAEQGLDALMGDVIAAYHESTGSADVVVVEGLLPAAGDHYLGLVSQELVKTLNAQVILVASRADRTTAQIDNQIEYDAKLFGGVDKILGMIVNRHPAAENETSQSLIDRYRAESRLLQRGLHLVGVVPQNPELTYCRTIDVQRHLNAKILSAGDIEKRRVKSTHLLARTVPNLLHTLVPGAILLTPADRSDSIIAIAMAALSQTPIAGLVLVGDTVLDERITKFCQAAFGTGLPLLRVDTNSYDTATRLHQLSSEVPIDDLERIQGAIDHAAQWMDVEWLISQSRKELEFRLSPAAFLHQLSERARKANKRIVLPEGPHCRSSRQRKTRRRFHPFSSCACRNRCWSMVTAQ